MYFVVKNIRMKRSSFRICFKYTKINEGKARFNEKDALVKKTVLKPTWMLIPFHGT